MANLNIETEVRQILELNWKATAHQICQSLNLHESFYPTVKNALLEAARLSADTNPYGGNLSPEISQWLLDRNQWIRIERRNRRNNTYVLLDSNKQKITEFKSESELRKGLNIPTH